MSTSLRRAGLFVVVAGTACVAPMGMGAQEGTETEPPGATVTLTVTILGVEKSEGVMRIALFDDPDRFTDDPMESGVLPVEGDRVTWQIEVVPGRYAIAAIHDRDRNGELNTNLVGMPREPYGFSNDARGRMGPPSFEDAAFDVGEDPLEIELTVR